MINESKAKFGPDIHSWNDASRKIHHIYYKGVKMGHIPFTVLGQRDKGYNPVKINGETKTFKTLKAAGNWIVGNEIPDDPEYSQKGKTYPNRKSSPRAHRRPSAVAQIEQEKARTQDLDVEPKTRVQKLLGTLKPKNGNIGPREAAAQARMTARMKNESEEPKQMTREETLAKHGIKATRAKWGVQENTTKDGKVLGHVVSGTHGNRKFEAVRRSDGATQTFYHNKAAAHVWIAGIDDPDVKDVPYVRRIGGKVNKPNKIRRPNAAQQEYMRQKNQEYRNMEEGMNSASFDDPPLPDKDPAQAEAYKAAYDQFLDATFLAQRGVDLRYNQPRTRAQKLADQGNIRMKNEEAACVNSASAAGGLPTVAEDPSVPKAKNLLKRITKRKEPINEALTTRKKNRKHRIGSARSGWRTKGKVYRDWDPTYDGKRGKG